MRPSGLPVPSRRFTAGLIALLFVVSSSALGDWKKLVAWFNFDWDNNIFNMPTRIVIFDKKTGAEEIITTAKLAVIKDRLGKPGTPEKPNEWENWEFRTQDRAKGSFRYFSDLSERPNVFVEDILEALKSGDQSWKGPSWKAFVRALSTEESARRLTIITARGHAPHTIWSGLKVLQEKLKGTPDELHFLPPEPPKDGPLTLRNTCIFPVTYPGMIPKYHATEVDVSPEKAAIMSDLLDRLQKEPVDREAPLVWNREGTALKRMHLWGFSDDDYTNFKKAVEVLSAGVRDRKWENVKITVFFTGKNHPTEKPHAVIITPTGTRELKAEEHGETPHYSATMEHIKRCLYPE